MSHYLAQCDIGYEDGDDIYWDHFDPVIEASNERQALLVLGHYALGGFAYDNLPLIRNVTVEPTNRPVTLNPKQLTTEEMTRL